MNVRPASLDLQLHYPFCYLDTKNNSDKIDHVINYMSHQFAKCFDVQYFFFYISKRTFVLQWEVIRC